ncbi:hypothetical protein HWV62_7992 [Athelia sp. TMB]|nr:hypothetical protein HWV62_7992 [Athelia sp. TMB]
MVDADRVLWLCGDQGCGKTILCSHGVDIISKHCGDTPSYACGYFFFDGRSEENQLSSYEGCLRSIIRQLWVRAGKIPDALREAYKTSTKATIGELEKTLQCIIENFTRVYIIIDGVDECSERNKLLRWIEKISSRKRGKLHMLLSSRAECDIEDRLLALPRSRRDVVRFSAKLSSSDIASYLDEKIADIPAWDQQTRVLIKGELLRGADGMFRWISLMIEELKDCYTVLALKDKLRRLPKSLEEIYERKLCSSADPQQLKGFLLWLIFAARPITVEELAASTIVDVESAEGPTYIPDRRFLKPRWVLNTCSGFVTEFGAALRAILAPYLIPLSLFAS